MRQINFLTKNSRPHRKNQIFGSPYLGVAVELGDRRPRDTICSPVEHPISAGTAKFGHSFPHFPRFQIGSRLPADLSEKKTPLPPVSVFTTTHPRAGAPLPACPTYGTVRTQRDRCPTQRATRSDRPDRPNAHRRFATHFRSRTHNFRLVAHFRVPTPPSRYCIGLVFFRFYATPNGHGKPSNRRPKVGKPIWSV